MESSWLRMEVDGPMVASFLFRWSGARAIALWFRSHADLAAAVVVAFGFFFQVEAARGRCLSPDEALHFDLVNVSGPAEAYRNARTNAHPPLFPLLLHFWLRLGRSELFLRQLPAIAGGAFLWFSYRWVGHLVGKTAGFMALLVLGVSPVLLPISGELRAYSLLLALCACALAQFESAIAARSPAGMIAFSLLLYLAILTHYAAVFVTASLFLYALTRFRSSRPPRRIVAIWAVLQVGAAALYLLLYFTQIAHLRGSEMERQAMTGWLDTSYFRPGRESAAWFVLRQTGAVFLYFFGSLAGAAVAFLFAAAGAVHLVLKRRPIAVLLALPFLLGAAAGLLGLYPFGGTRHSVYLLPFATATIGAFFSAQLEKRRWAVLLPAVVLIPLLGGTAGWSAPSPSLAEMRFAIDRLRTAVPAGSLIFTDQRTAVVMSYYLGHHDPTTGEPGPGGFGERGAGPYCMIGSPLWTPAPAQFIDEMERFIDAYRLSPGQRFWAIRNGSEYDLALELSRRFPRAVFPVFSRLADTAVVEVWPRGRPAGAAVKTRKSAAVSDPR